MEFWIIYFGGVFVNVVFGLVKLGIFAVLIGFVGEDKEGKKLV